MYLPTYLETETVRKRGRHETVDKKNYYHSLKALLRTLTNLLLRTLLIKREMVDSCIKNQITARCTPHLLTVTTWLNGSRNNCIAWASQQKSPNPGLYSTTERCGNWNRGGWHGSRHCNPRPIHSHQQKNHRTGNERMERQQALWQNL